MTKLKSILLSSLLIGISLQAQENGSNGKSYPDGHGGTVFFPAGDISFADKVVSFKKGDPSAAEKDSNPEEAVGIPNYDTENDSRYVSLGCGGTLVLAFEDNAVIDIPGPDLYVFEVGSDIEPTSLSLSKDGENWLEIGRISGGKAEIDIAPYVTPQDSFRYVKLTDLKTACGSSWPGSDIDAVGAIGSGMRLSLNSSFLFDFGKFDLKPEAKQELHKLAMKLQRFPGGTITVEGHTDSVGSDEANNRLSQKRAQAVVDHMTQHEDLKQFKFIAHGYGESRPIASNKTKEGRQKNRRVDMVVRLTAPKNSTDTAPSKALPPKKVFLTEWETNWGKMHLQKEGEKIKGTYSDDNGEVIGKLTDANTMEGYWIEDESDHKCDTPKNGRYYWGRLKMTFSNNMSTFDALWGYCNDTPSKKNFSGHALR